MRGSGGRARRWWGRGRTVVGVARRSVSRARAHAAVAAAQASARRRSENVRVEAALNAHRRNEFEVGAVGARIVHETTAASGRWTTVPEPARARHPDADYAGGEASRRRAHHHSRSFTPNGFFVRLRDHFPAAAPIGPLTAPSPKTVSPRGEAASRLRAHEIRPARAAARAVLLRVRDP